MSASRVARSAVKLLKPYGVFISQLNGIDQLLFVILELAFFSGYGIFYLVQVILQLADPAGGLKQQQALLFESRFRSLFLRCNAYFFIPQRGEFTLLNLFRLSERLQLARGEKQIDAALFHL